MMYHMTLLPHSNAYLAKAAFMDAILDFFPSKVIESKKYYYIDVSWLENFKNDVSHDDIVPLKRVPCYGGHFGRHLE